MTRVIFSSQARADLRAAAAFYAATSPRLTARFGAEVEAAVHRVAESPATWPPVNARLRRCLLDRFPYSLVYRTDSDPVRVIAVMHHRQRPGYWRGRA